MNILGDFMNRFFTRYLNRSGLVTAGLMVSIGMIELFRALRNHDRAEAIGVAIIFFIVMPAFALWARRLPQSMGKRGL